MAGRTMTFEIIAWNPQDDGDRTEWRWYWRCDVKKDRVLIASLNQPYYVEPFETKSDAEAAARQVIADIQASGQLTD